MSLIELKKITSPIDKDRNPKVGAPAEIPPTIEIFFPMEPVGNPPLGLARPPTNPISEPKPLTRPLRVASDPGPPGYKKIVGK